MLLLKTFNAPQMTYTEWGESNVNNWNKTSLILNFLKSVLHIVVSKRKWTNMYWLTSVREEVNKLALEWPAGFPGLWYC